MAEIVLTNTGVDAFLAAHPEFRGSGAARAADAVLGLLALRGAERAGGMPEPTPALIRRLLLEDLPAFVGAAPAELDVYPAVLRALVAGLDGDRRQRAEAALAEAEPDFARAMGDPGNLTWHRWYAQRLRADGTDPGDPGAVRDWLARLDGPPLPDGMRRADLMGRTALADVLLAEVLTRAYVRDAEHPPAAGPLLGDHDVAQGIGTVAQALLDRWTAAGLAEGLAGPYAHLAPGPDDFPHLVLADALLDEHLDYYGDPAVPLPPPESGATTGPGRPGTRTSRPTPTCSPPPSTPSPARTGRTPDRTAARPPTCSTRSTSAAAPPSRSPAAPPSSRTGPSTPTWRTRPSPYRRPARPRTPPRTPASSAGCSARPASPTPTGPGSTSPPANSPPSSTGSPPPDWSSATATPSG
ncbi:hypothetical protein AB6O49_28510 [Streptomyces sp. SBR177]